MKYPITTQKELREAFWDSEPSRRFRRHLGWKQNQYPTDVRVAFVDYVDYLQRNGQISEALAERVTL